MLVGRFGNTSGAPYIEARVSFPRLQIRGHVSFLIDTGADGTVFMPADSKKFGIDFRILQKPTTSEGIGGTARGFIEQALLTFTDNRRYLYHFLLDIEISAPARHNQRFPSLLGRDILKSGRFVMSRQSNTITLMPRTWSLRQTI